MSVLTKEQIERLRADHARVIQPERAWTNFLDTIADLQCQLELARKNIHELAKGTIESYEARIIKLKRQAQVREERPWLYAIQDKNGKWKDGEQCVFGDEQSCKDEVEMLNDDLPEGEPEYYVAPLYRAKQQADKEEKP